MALNTMSSTDLLNFLIFETIYGNPLKNTTDCSNIDHHSINGVGYNSILPSQDVAAPMPPPPPPPMSCFHEKNGISRNKRPPNLATQGKKKRRRRPKACKNEEEAETQRMAHIVVERNRRKQMNEHLAVVRSLMPQSYSQKGDQASIVGGAIEYVKELEHLLQSLQSKKKTKSTTKISTPPFTEFFSFPQYSWSKSPMNSNSAPSIADIEVTLIECHANVRILTRRRPRQLSKLVGGFQSLHLCILHLNVTSLESLVLYSISAKVEEGCHLTSVNEIAEATNHMLRIIEEEVALC